MFELNPNTFLSQVVPRLPILLGQAKVSFEKTIERSKRDTKSRRQQKKYINHLISQVRELLLAFKEDTTPNLFVAPLPLEAVSILEEEMGLGNPDPFEIIEKANEEDPARGTCGIALSLPDSSHIRGFSRMDAIEVYKPPQNCFMGLYNMLPDGAPNNDRFTIIPQIKLKLFPPTIEGLELDCQVQIYDSFDKTGMWLLIDRVNRVAIRQKNRDGKGEIDIAELLEEIELFDSFKLAECIREHEALLYGELAREELISCLELDELQANYVREKWLQSRDEDEWALCFGPRVSQASWHIENNKTQSPKKWTCDRRQKHSAFSYAGKNNDERVALDTQAIDTFLELAKPTLETLRHNNEAWKNLTNICVSG